MLAHFGQDHFLERYQRYKAHIAEWRQQYPKLAAVDLRYEQQVVLEMNRGQANAQPAQNATNPTAVAAKPVPAKSAAVAPPKYETSAKPDPAKRASVSSAQVSHGAKKPAVAHPVSAHANGRTPTKASLKAAAAKKAKDNKHRQTKPAAQKKTKPKPKTHVTATADPGQ